MVGFDLDDEVRKINGGIKSETRGYNSTTMPTLEQPREKQYDFENMGERIAEGMLQAAKEQLMEAENMLRQTEQFAADIQQRVAAKAAELVDMNNRLRVLGASIVTAHKVFCGDVEKDKP